MRDASWKEENRDWITAHRRWVEENELPPRKIPAVLMARFDVYSLANGSLVVDCQADFLDEIGTRFVVPLLPRGEGPAPHARINPVIAFRDETLVLVPQLAAALRTSELRRREGSLDHEHYTITHAIDVMIGTA